MKKLGNALYVVLVFFYYSFLAIIAVAAYFKYTQFDYDKYFLLSVIIPDAAALLVPFLSIWNKKFCAVLMIVISVVFYFIYRDLLNYFFFDFLFAPIENAITALNE